MKKVISIVGSFFSLVCVVIGIGILVFSLFGYMLTASGPGMFFLGFVMLVSGGIALR